jgi:iron complex transport system permease protein
MIAPPAAPRTEAHRSALGRELLAWGLPVLLLISAVALALTFGATNLTPARVLDGLFNTGTPLDRTIVYEIRLPRVLLALAVGASLATAGTLLQGVTRNPLADPHVLGLTAAGALAAAVAIKISADVPQAILAPVAALGAFGGAALVYGMSWRGGVSPVRLALSGVAVAALFTSGITTLLVTSNLSTQNALAFLAGGLFGRGWDDFHVTWPYTIGGLIAALLLSRSMNILALGDEPAASLGLSVERTRVFAVATAAFLAGASVATAGMVAFVGLVVPHAGRFLVGDDHRKLIPLSAILGAALVVYADLFARVVVAPVEIPLGIVTAAVGAPFLLYLVRSKT